MAEQIRRVAVWSPRLRLAHWLMAGATLVLLATGWLLDKAPSLAQAASDYHYLAAAVLTFAIALRLWIGWFGQGAERFASLLLSATDVRAARESLVFYLSFGKAPLPNWFAHNPLWKPLYLLWFLVLFGSLVTGWVMPDTPLVAGVYLPTLHGWLANATGMLLVLHLFSVALQDLRGQSADVSAMIVGHRYFSIDRDKLVRPEIPSVSVRLDDIQRGDKGDN
jgi:Ni/Fe-hydrogenase 1 B-type cytochrome subunit